MHLVACPGCRTHYDVSGTPRDSFTCPCGATVEVREVRPVDAVVQRCGSCGAPVDHDAEICAYCRAPIAREGETSLICPECYARNLRESRYCTACGIVFRPHPLPEDATPVSCVRCAQPTSVRMIDGTAVQECRLCHGVWVPGEGFDALVSRAIEAWKKTGPDLPPARAPRRTGGNPVAARVEYRKCPECGAVMNRRNYRRTSGVIIDLCPEHGTWLDADELERIAGFILSGGLDRAKAAEATTMKAAKAHGATRPTATSAAFERVMREHRPTHQRGAAVLESVVDFFSQLLR